MVRAGSTPGRADGSAVAAGAVILLATAAVYWRALGAGFVGDDFMIVYRLRPVAGFGDAFRFFRGEFFDYYRPLAFISHSVDWLIAGTDARQFHLSNLVLHLANTTLVLLIARSLLSGIPAAAVAALLFALHASNHEAVVWISARFDLLATFFSLSAVLCLVRGHNIGGAMLFFPALLSKESAVALPVAAAAWWVFRERVSTIGAIARTMPWLASLAAYAILRSVAGGVSPSGGRLPKLVVFGAALTIVLVLGDSRWLRLRDGLRDRRRLAAAALGVAVLAVAGLAAWGTPSLGALAREKLAVAGFAVLYLLSPVVDVALTPHFLDPSTRVYWIGGVAALLLAIAVAIALWPYLLDGDVLFVLALFAATLLPISALTEGKRYLYLPSAAFSLLTAVLIERLVATASATLKRRAAYVIVVIVAYTAISGWQIHRKTGDWLWAGRMTAEGARLVDSRLAPQCGGHVVFLTSPVAIRGVYTHFYYETFEIPRGCRPDVFQVLARVVRLDTRVEAAWAGPNRITITAHDYPGNFVLSRDLRHFDMPLRAERTASITTPLGRVDAEAFGALQRVTLTLDPSVDVSRIRFFYYSEEGIRELTGFGGLFGKDQTPTSKSQS